VTGTGGDNAFVVADLRIDRDVVLPALRGLVGAVLHDLGEDHSYDVLLVVTELVNNVRDHPHGPGRRRVLRSRTPCEISVEVDDSSPLRPLRGRSRLDGSRGRGMVMVDTVSNEWGTRPRPGGKTVFALIGCGVSV
jgi:anti-sigma regulatory factor (Ser/Thr protein kinase)